MRCHGTIIGLQDLVFQSFFKGLELELIKLSLALTLAIYVNLYTIDNPPPKIKEMGRIYALSFCSKIQLGTLLFSRRPLNSSRFYLNKVVHASRE